MSRAIPVLLSLGSNIDPERNLPEALRRLRARLRVVAVSRVYRTRAVGPGPAPPFLNAAVLVESERSARRLKFEVLRPIEAEMGRVRSANRNAPRTIDLDIALFGESEIEDRGAGLQIPDPGILAHPHLALPLADLAPETLLPGSDRTLGEIAAGFAEAAAPQELEGWSLGEGDEA